MRRTAPVKGEKVKLRNIPSQHPYAPDQEGERERGEEGKGDIRAVQKNVGGNRQGKPKRSRKMRGR